MSRICLHDREGGICGELKVLPGEFARGLTGAAFSAEAAFGAQKKALGLDPAIYKKQLEARLAVPGEVWGQAWRGPKKGVWP